MAEASEFKTASGLGALHHVGLAANDRTAVVSLYRDLLGYELSHVDDVPSQQLEALVFGKGAELIEVLIPRSADSAVGRFLAKRGTRHASSLLCGRGPGCCDRRIGRMRRATD